MTEVETLILVQMTVYSRERDAALHQEHCLLWTCRWRGGEQDQTVPWDSVSLVWDILLS